ncbi:hypothetical protein AC249_AIPGENE20215 [Exaiptasia diaphana]|nr:hypothetical protein AC249_AIPGENE20215 [Exaiptasia diaphana]
MSESESIDRDDLRTSRVVTRRKSKPTSSPNSVKNSPEQNLTLLKTYWEDEIEQKSKKSEESFKCDKEASSSTSRVCSCSARVRQYYIA